MLTEWFHHCIFLLFNAVSPHNLREETSIVQVDVVLWHFDKVHSAAVHPAKFVAIGIDVLGLDGGVHELRDEVQTRFDVVPGCFIIFELIPLWRMFPQVLHHAIQHIINLLVFGFSDSLLLTYEDGDRECYQCLVDKHVAGNVHVFKGHVFLVRLVKLFQLVEFQTLRVFRVFRLIDRQQVVDVWFHMGDWRRVHF